jgi:hydroxymethylglutaryl-CoA lyase
MQGMGIETGVDLNQVVEIGDFISKAIGRPNASRAGKALLAQRRTNAEEI